MDVNSYVGCAIEKRKRLLERLGTAACLLVGLVVGTANANQQALPGVGEQGGAPEACLYARHVRNIEVINEQMLVLRGTADRYWLSRLPARCVGLKDPMHLVVHQYGSKYCRNDRFEARESMGGFYTSCRFGEFEPISPASVDALKVAAN